MRDYQLQQLFRNKVVKLTFNYGSWLEFIILQLLDNEEDAENTFVIGNDWENPTRLTVQIINAFDHDGDGIATEQMANKTFEMNISQYCI